MKIGILLNSGSRNAGGIFDIARNFAGQLAARASPSDVVAYCTRDEEFTEDAAQWQPVSIQAFNRRFPSSWGYSPELNSSIMTGELDVLMTHGLWQYCSVVAHRWRKSTRRPEVIHTHGMLDPWALRNSQSKKRIAAFFYENAHLRDASCICASSEAEAQAVLDYGLKNPVCVIPNGVALPNLGLQASAPWGDQAKGRRVLLYLGRIHPKKNLLSLLRGWALMQEQRERVESWVLVIAGWDQNQHEAQLRQEAAHLGLQESVIFAGPLFNEARGAAYLNASAFVLPSFSEGLPMAVLEAWAHGLPVLMTRECNIPEGFAASAAWPVTTEAEGIRQGLDVLTAQTDAQLKTVGSNGRSLVEQRFSWQKSGEELWDVVRWITGGGPQPKSLYAKSSS